MCQVLGHVQGTSVGLDFGRATGRRLPACLTVQALVWCRTAVCESLSWLAVAGCRAGKAQGFVCSQRCIAAETPGWEPVELTMGCRAWHPACCSALFGCLLLTFGVAGCVCVRCGGWCGMRLNEGLQWRAATLLTCSCLCSVLAVLRTQSTARHSHVCVWVGVAGYACLLVAWKAGCLVLCAVLCVGRVVCTLCVLLAVPALLVLFVSASCCRFCPSNCCWWLVCGSPASGPAAGSSHVCVCVVGVFLCCSSLCVSLASVLPFSRVCACLCCKLRLE